MKMRLSRKPSSLQWEDDFTDQEFDIYSEEFDDEEGMDRGMKGFEVAFLRGFKRFN